MGLREEGSLAADPGRARLRAIGLLRDVILPFPSALCLHLGAPRTNDPGARAEQDLEIFILSTATNSCWRAVFSTEKFL